MRPDIPFTFPKFLQTIAIMSQVTRAIAVYLLATANIALAANCFDTPKWTWYGDALYSDVWGARSTLCTRGAAPCANNPDETISCQVKVGNAYAVMEGINLDDMYTYCGVCNSSKLLDGSCDLRLTRCNRMPLTTLMISVYTLTRSAETITGTKIPTGYSQL